MTNRQDKLRKNTGARHIGHRTTFTGCVLGVTIGLVIPAVPASASDTLPWAGESAVGENQPYQHGYTVPDLLDWDPAQDRYAPLLRDRKSVV